MKKTILIIECQIVILMLMFFSSFLYAQNDIYKTIEDSKNGIYLNYSSNLIVKSFNSDELPINQSNLPFNGVNDLEINNGNSFFASYSNTYSYINGVRHLQQFSPGPAVQNPFYTNGVLDFLQGDTTEFECVYPNGIHPDTKFYRIRSFYKLNSFPLDPNNLVPTILAARDFAMSYGEPNPEVIFIITPNIPPNEQIFRYVLLSGTPLNELHQPIAADPIGRTILILGFIDSHLYPTNSSYFIEMFAGMTAPTRKWDYVDPSNYKALFEGVSIGSRDSNSTVIYPGLMVNSIMNVNLISTQAPGKYFLSQNYPNPFNPMTKIKFDVMRAGNVSIKVFDLLGKEVVTIVDKKMEPGIYVANWNAGNLSSGIYFYRMQAGDFNEIKKMILVK